MHPLQCEGNVRGAWTPAPLIQITEKYFLTCVGDLACTRALLCALPLELSLRVANESTLMLVPVTDA